MHLSKDHYEPIIEGNAVTVIGTAEQVRQVTIMLCALRDECGTCGDDAIDAVALNGNTAAVLHRIETLMDRGELIRADSDEGELTAESLWGMPFALRRAVVESAGRKIAARFGRTHSGWA